MRAHVDVEHAGSGCLLLIGEVEGLCEHALLQLGGELLLACGIDALANDHKGFVLAYAHHILTAREDNAGMPFGFNPADAGRAGFHGLSELTDMLGARAAAAAHQLAAHGREGSGEFGETFGAEGKDGLAVDELGHAGVGLSQHKALRAGLQEALNHRRHEIRPEAAVGAEGVHAQVLHGFGENFRRGAGEAHALLEGHGYHDRQVGYAARGHHGCPRLGNVKLRLDENAVAASAGESADLTFEAGYEFLGIEVAKGFLEMSAGTDIACHAHGAPCRVRGLPGYFGHAAVELLHLKAGIQLEGAAAEGIRKNDVRTRSNVFLMDGQKDIGPLHAVKRRGYACRHPLGLEHGAHGTVEKNGPVLGEQFFEAGRHWQPL